MQAFRTSLFPRPGTIVRVFTGDVFHVGLVTDQSCGSQPYVIHASKRLGRVAEEPLDQFAQGAAVEVIEDPGLAWGSLQAVMTRARSRLGDVYSLINFNCEHFVTWALGRPVQSRQLAAWGIAVAAIGAAIGLYILVRRSN